MKLPGAVAVIGAGSWGTTLAHVLARKGIPVKLWVRRPELAAMIIQGRQNPDYLPGISLASGISVSTSMAEAVAGCRFLICALPSHAVRSHFTDFGATVPAHATLISTTKGIEEGSLLTMTQILSELLFHIPSNRVLALSGPSFAREVALGKPTAITVAGPDPGPTASVQDLFTTTAVRVYTNFDKLGVELGGAYKNVIAIAAGTCDGLELGHSARGALITRGLAEISRLGVAMGANPETFAGLTGLGDLVLTCTGELSRNRFVGLELGRGKPLREILEKMRMVAEGVRTTRAIVSLGEKYGIDLPIAREVCAILHDGKNPRQSVMDLMGRDLKAE